MNKVHREISKLDNPHKASLVYYNYGWFKVYENWDEDCDQTKDNNFIYSKRYSKNIKLILADPGEKDSINDVLAHIHHQVTEQISYILTGESRLKIKRKYKRELHELQKLKN